MRYPNLLTSTIYCHPLKTSGLSKDSQLGGTSSHMRPHLFPHHPSSSLVALRSLSCNISQRFPVLISGPPSCGKNTIIQKLAAQLWSRNLMCDHSMINQSEFDQNVVTLNLASRTLDAKSFVGSYVSSTEDPGKFVFVEGPLLGAMKEGKWLVCQDIDRASDVRVFQQLISLRSRTSF